MTSKPVSKKRPSAWTTWGVNAEQHTDVPEFEIRAKVKAVLRGHGGGVLDLRVDDKWIVSW
jgi:F-box and WD-40 domain protein 1/11